MSTPFPVGRVLSCTSTVVWTDKLKVCACPAFVLVYQLGRLASTVGLLCCWMANWLRCVLA